MRTVYIPSNIKIHLTANNRTNDSNFDLIRKRITKLRRGIPEVSIVIPAFNEEATLFQTLSSLAASTTYRSVEILVVNNNSTDQTAYIVERAGVQCIDEKNQGYMHARNAGLFKAQGKYVLNADADSIYPPEWIDCMVQPMEDDSRIAVVYGRCAFCPSAGRSRLSYFTYELAGDISASLTKRIKNEAMFVMGFNSGFRRELAIKVDGFRHPKGTNEDGYLAVKLSSYGRIRYCKESIIWTSDRRLVEEGSLVVSFSIRVKRFLSRLRAYIAASLKFLIY